MKNSKNKYKKSFLIVYILILLGFAIQYISSGEGVSMPAFPINLLIIVFLIAYQLLTYFVFRKTEVVSWFTSIPLTLAVISGYTLLVIIMGFVSQTPHNHFIDKIGLTDIKHSYAFFLVSVLLLLVLGYTIIKRLTQKLSLRNFAFFLNHAGLFIVISAGSLGTGDLIRVSMPVSEGEYTNIAYDNNNEKFAVPFDIGLNNFTIEQYPPEIILYDRQTGYAIIEEGGKLPFAKEGKKGHLGELDFEVIEYHEFAVKKDDKYVPTEQFGSVHVAKIKISDGKREESGWVSTDNFMYTADFLFFYDDFVIGLLEPKVLKYQSNVNIIENNQNIKENILIEVNKPLRYSGWTIYQNSYDGRFGRWSRTSIFELIKDPWLPVVYVGIYMLIFGSVYLIFTGRQLNVHKYKSKE